MDDMLQFCQNSWDTFVDDYSDLTYYFNLASWLFETKNIRAKTRKNRNRKQKLCQKSEVNVDVDKVEIDFLLMTAKESVLVTLFRRQLVDFSLAWHRINGFDKHYFVDFDALMPYRRELSPILECYYSKENVFRADMYETFCRAYQMLYYDKVGNFKVNENVSSHHNSFPFIIFPEILLDFAEKKVDTENFNKRNIIVVANIRHHKTKNVELLIDAKPIALDTLTSAEQATLISQRQAAMMHLGVTELDPCLRLITKPGFKTVIKYILTLQTANLERAISLLRMNVMNQNPFDFFVNVSYYDYLQRFPEDNINKLEVKTFCYEAWQNFTMEEKQRFNPIQ